MSNRIPDVAIVHITGQTATLNIYRYDEHRVEQIEINERGLLKLNAEIGAALGKMEVARSR
ncbi:MAG: hypothetical protein NXI16_01370 [Alphaproteobacteria bacterium]|nr:hypothetical protein [Alphaproteobacteria bacterium]